jgi:hypothetical protein
VDWIIPIGAILVICASLGSVFLDPNFQPTRNKSELLKAYAPKAERCVR